MERPSNRPTDTELIQTGIAAWNERERDGAVDDTTARIIASRWHGGQDSALYWLASSGCIEKTTLALEVAYIIQTTEMTEDDDAELEALTHYIIEHGQRDPVEGWHSRTQW